MDVKSWRDDVLKDASDWLFPYLVLKRNKRLSSRDKIEEIVEKGRVKQSPFLICRYQKNELSSDRYATVISTKVQKSAVKRNLLRRQIFECLRALENVPEREHFDIVLFVRRPLLKESFESLKKILESSLKSL